MKKLFAALLAAAMIMVFAAGCTGSTTAKVETGDEAASLKASDYKNNFEGLCNYLSAYGYINPMDESTYTVMDASLIGASQGKKFVAQKTKNTTIEIYEYKTDKNNATADEIVSSVKNNGTFSVLELPDVKAYLSDNGRFLMIYTDSSINDDDPDKDSDNYKTREEVLEKFKAFHA